MCFSLPKHVGIHVNYITTSMFGEEGGGVVVVGRVAIPFARLLPFFQRVIGRVCTAVPNSWGPFPPISGMVPWQRCLCLQHFHQRLMLLRVVLTDGQHRARGRPAKLRECATMRCVWTEWSNRSQPQYSATTRAAT